MSSAFGRAKYYEDRCDKLRRKVFEANVAIKRLEAQYSVALDKIEEQAKEISSLKLAYLRSRGS